MTHTFIFSSTPLNRFVFGFFAPGKRRGYGPFTRDQSLSQEFGCCARVSPEKALFFACNPKGVII
jgi:hypothetical protein